MSTTVFIVVIALVMLMDVVGRVINILRGDYAPARKPRDYLIDSILNAMILAWAILLLIWGKP